MSIEPDTAPSMGATPYEPPSRPTVQGRMSGPASGENTSAASRTSSSMLSALYKAWDVDTEDVLFRCSLSLNPLLNTPFLTNGMLDNEHASSPENIVHNKSPDMWGPVWIFLTMVFAVFFAATTSGLFNGSWDKYDATLLSGTAITLAGFTFVVPIGAWFIIQYYDLVPTLTLLQTVCLYGYSCTIWIPAVLVAGSPLGAERLVGKAAALVVRIVSIAIAFLMSSRFIYGNLFKVMSAQASDAVTVSKTKMTLVLCAGVLIHAALAFTILTITFIRSAAEA